MWYWWYSWTVRKFTLARVSFVSPWPSVILPFGTWPRYADWTHPHRSVAEGDMWEFSDVWELREAMVSQNLASPLPTLQSWLCCGHLAGERWDTWSARVAFPSIPHATRLFSVFPHLFDSLGLQSGATCLILCLFLFPNPLSPMDISFCIHPLVREQ